MVDLAFLEKFTKGDSAKMQRYIRMYLTESSPVFEKMEACIKNKDWAKLAICAHSLKPQVEFMGIDSLKQVLMAIENKAKIKAYDALEDLYREALQLHTTSCEQLKIHLKNL